MRSWHEPVYGAAAAVLVASLVASVTSTCLIPGYGVSTASGTGGSGASTGGGAAAASGGAPETTSSGGSSGCGDVQSDPLNCGKCGWDCLGGTCSDGECQAVVVVQGIQGQDDFGHLALDADALYWAHDGKVSWVAKDAPPLSLPEHSTADVGADFVAADGTSFYWSVIFSGQIRGALKATPDVATTFTTGENTPVGLMVSSGFLYWSNYALDSALRVEAVSSKMAMDLAIDVDQALFVLPVGQEVYWSYKATGNGDGGVRKIVRAKVTDIATGQNSPVGLAVDTNDVYWVAGDGSVSKSTKDGGAPPPGPTQLAPPEASLFYSEIVVDDIEVYWTGASTVWRARKDGNGVREDFGGATWAFVAAVKMDDRAVYWTTGLDAQLVRKVKRAPP